MPTKIAQTITNVSTDTSTSHTISPGLEQVTDVVFRAKNNGTSDEVVEVSFNASMFRGDFTVPADGKFHDCTVVLYMDPVIYPGLSVVGLEFLSISSNIEISEINFYAEGEGTSVVVTAVESVGVNALDLTHALNDCLKDNGDGTYTLTKVSASGRFSGKIPFVVKKDQVMFCQFEIVDTNIDGTSFITMQCFAADGSTTVSGASFCLVDGGEYFTMKGDVVHYIRTYIANEQPVGAYITFRNPMIQFVEYYLAPVKPYSPYFKHTYQVDSLPISVAVEEGGTVTFLNENNVAVPSTINYYKNSKEDTVYAGKFVGEFIGDVASRSYVKEAVSKANADKVGKLNTAYKVYATDGNGNDISASWTTGLQYNQCIPRCDNNGRQHIVEPVDANNPTTKKYVDGKVTDIVNYVDDQISSVSGGGSSSSPLQYGTTLYTADQISSTFDSEGFAIKPFTARDGSGNPYEGTYGIKISKDGKIETKYTAPSGFNNGTYAYDSITIKIGEFKSKKNKTYTLPNNLYTGNGEHGCYIYLTSSSGNVEPTTTEVEQTPYGIVMKYNDVTFTSDTDVTYNIMLSLSVKDTVIRDYVENFGVVATIPDAWFNDFDAYLPFLNYIYDKLGTPNLIFGTDASGNFTSYSVSDLAQTLLAAMPAAEEGEF